MRALLNRVHIPAFPFYRSQKEQQRIQMQIWVVRVFRISQGGVDFNVQQY